MKNEKDERQNHSKFRFVVSTYTLHWAQDLLMYYLYLCINCSYDTYTKKYF